MDTKYKKFIDLANKKKECAIKEKDLFGGNPDGYQMHIFYSTLSRINFFLSYSTIEHTGGIQMTNSLSQLFELDEEDLEYLTKKYSGKLKEEYEKNLAELNSKYSV